MHASGFKTQTEGLPTPPMRISRILDALQTDKQAVNYVAVVGEIRTIIHEQYRFSNVYHVNELALETLLYLPQYNNFRQIHEPTIWYLSDQEQKTQRECSGCGIT